MPVRIADIIEFMDEWAPPSYAGSWDNPGLQVGDPASAVETVLVAVDATPAVVDEAVGLGAQLIITHHPLIFKPVNSINTAAGPGGLLARLISSGISVFSAHTNLDVAMGGVDDTLAAAVGIEGRDGSGPGDGPRVLEPTGEDSLIKLVVFVPKGHEDKVRDAIAAAGAGWIGNYSHCTFQAPGTGTFKPLEGANPFLGTVGQIEKAEELRLETILPESAKARVLKAMFESHPYEEVAFDLYPLRNPGRARGSGRVGDLHEPVSLGDLASRLAGILNAPCVRVFGDPSRRIAKVATSVGSGGDHLYAAAGAGADVLVTGDIKYTHAVAAAALNLALIDVGHFSSERPVVVEIVRRLNQRFKPVQPRFCARASGAEAEPFVVVSAASSGAPAREEPAEDGRGSKPTVRSTGTVVAYVDGGSRGNPGPAAYAVVLLDGSGNTLVEEGIALSQATNNVAEYRAVIEAAKRARVAGASRLIINTDSELVARQISGEYRVKNAGLSGLYEQALAALREFESWEVRHIPREENRRADRLVNKALDSAEGSA
ncbi:MAG: Nif3-like dinuclear metal center hexameric protein [Firmicutes bacterium]|nr:Nif3-like dinuclear metal center hexameric protein [Bacillota bacterium]